MRYAYAAHVTKLLLALRNMNLLLESGPLRPKGKHALKVYFQNWKHLNGHLALSDRGFV